MPLKPLNPDALLYERDAAEILSVSCRTLQSWRLRKDGPPYVRVGRLVRYRYDLLIEFINSNTRRS
jgi:hypothetical protein